MAQENVVSLLYSKTMGSFVLLEAKLDNGDLEVMYCCFEHPIALAMLLSGDYTSGVEKKMN